MSMPNDLVFVRHGQSEGNIIQMAANHGDDSYYERDESLMTVPDHRWRLTPQGVEQAQRSGEWINKNFRDGFDRYIYSPYTRTRETAGSLGLVHADTQPVWEANRSVRERSWGEIGSIPRSKFREEYPRSANFKHNDPLYWAPPGGESIADVAENRVRNLLSTLHRENERDSVIVVSHGEFMWASRMVIERWSDAEFVAYDRDPAMKIHNCQVIHYTRSNPWTGEIAPRLQWVRRMSPLEDGLVEEDWKEFGRQRMTNSEMLLGVAELPRLVNTYN